MSDFTKHQYDHSHSEGFSSSAICLSMSAVVKVGLRKWRSSVTRDGLQFLCLSSALHTYTCRSAALEKLEVAERRSGAPPYFDHCMSAASDFSASNFKFLLPFYTADEGLAFPIISQTQHVQLSRYHRLSFSDISQTFPWQNVNSWQCQVSDSPSKW